MKTLKFILAILAIVALPYFAVAFKTWIINPGNWSTGERVTAILLFFGLAGMAVTFDLFKSDKDKKSIND